MSLRLVAITILMLLTSLVFASAVDARPSNQDPDLNDPGNWWTYANGDEIIALEVHPEDGRLLAGTDGGGLIVWDEDLDDFRQVIFPNQRGFQASTVYDIAVDPVSGDLWLATDYGVAHAQDVPAAAPSAWVWTTYINTYAGVEESVDGVVQVDEDGMPETRVFSAIAVGADGRVYVGTPASGVAIRDVDGAWTKVESDLFVSDPSEPVEGPADLSISDIAVRIDAQEPEENEVWFVHGRADTDAAVSRYLPATGEWFHTPSQGRGGNPELGPTDHQVVSLSVDPSTGVVWLGMWNQGVFRYDPVEDVWSQTQRNQDGLCTSGGSVGIWAIDAVDGSAWAACGPVSKGVGRGVAHFDGSGWTTYSGGDPMPDDVISALAIGLDGQVFLGHENYDESGPIGGYGIVAYTAGGTPRRLSTAGRLPPLNELTTLLFDSRGRLWAGTRGGGLLLRQENDEWRRFTRDDTGSALRGDTITDLLQRGDELWIGSAERVYDSSTNRYLDGGISRYDLSNDTWGEPIVPVEDPSPGVPEGLPDGQVSALADAGDGGVWIAFGETSVSNAFNGRGVAYFNEGDPADTVDDNWIWWDPDLAESMGGRTVLDVATVGGELWAAMSYAMDGDGQRAKGGVSRLIDPIWDYWGDGEDGFRSYSDERITGDVRSIFADSRGIVWAGTYDSPDSQSLLSDKPLFEAVINRWDPAAQDWVAWGWERQGWVSAIAEDSFEQIWAATTRDVEGEYWPGKGVRDIFTSDVLTVDGAADGLFVFDPFDETWQALRPVASGLADEQVTDIALDPSTGHMWVAYVNHGVSEYSVGQAVGPTFTPLASATPRPSRTPCPGGACPTDTPSPTNTASPVPSVTSTLAPFETVAPAESTRAEATRRATEAPVSPDEPEPPPEVPEPATLWLFAAGLAVMSGWMWWRRRTLEAVGG